MSYVYAWLAVARQHKLARPPKAAVYLAKAMIYIITHEPPRHPAYYTKSNTMGATDAAGYEANLPKLGRIGGWWVDAPGQCKSQAKWFSIAIPKHEAWAYKQGSSQRRIAALELMGTIVITKLIAMEGDRPPSHLTTPLATDNKGNAFNIAKDKARQHQLNDLMMELALTCYMSRIQVGAYHVKRASNTWADALADGDYAGFEPQLRRDFDLYDDENWWIWPALREQEHTSPPGALRTPAGFGPGAGRVGHN